MTPSPDRPVPDGRPRPPFLFAVPLAILGGPIGLGGTEFRLPVLVGALGYPPRQAVPLNLAVSIVTIATSLANRARSRSLDPCSTRGRRSSPSSAAR